MVTGLLLWLLSGINLDFEAVVVWCFGLKVINWVIVRALELPVEAWHAVLLNSSDELVLAVLVIGHQRLVLVGLRASQLGVIQILLLVKENVSILYVGFDERDVLPDCFDHVVIVAIPVAGFLVLDVTVVMSTNRRVPFVHDHSVKPVHMIVFLRDLLLRIFVSAHRQILFVNLDLLVEVKWVLQFGAVDAESLHVNDQDARNYKPR